MSRRVAAVDEPRGFAPGEHVCWAYDDRPGWRTALTAFLAEGVTRGERLLYLGSPGTDADALVADLDLDLLPDRDRLLDDGGLIVRAAPPDDVCHLERDVREAADRGAAGLRVAREVTARAHDADPALLAGEELTCDLLAADTGLVALCGYERRRAPARAATVLQIVHPLRRRVGADDYCWLTAGGTGVGRERAWRLSGELDAVLATHLTTVARTLPLDRELHVDLADLAFVDTTGVAALLGLAAARPAATTMHHVRTLVADLVATMAPVLHPALEARRDGDRVCLTTAGAGR